MEIYVKSNTENGVYCLEVLEIGRDVETQQMITKLENEIYLKYTFQKNFEIKNLNSVFELSIQWQFPPTFRAYIIAVSIF